MPPNTALHKPNLNIAVSDAINKIDAAQIAFDEAKRALLTAQHEAVDVAMCHPDAIAEYMHRNPASIQRILSLI